MIAGPHFFHQTKTNLKDLSCIKYSSKRYWFNNILYKTPLNLQTIRSTLHIYWEIHRTLLVHWTSLRKQQVHWKLVETLLVRQRILRTQLIHWMILRFIEQSSWFSMFTTLLIHWNIFRTLLVLKTPVLHWRNLTFIGLTCFSKQSHTFQFELIILQRSTLSAIVINKPSKLKKKCHDKIYFYLMLFKKKNIITYMQK